MLKSTIDKLGRPVVFLIALGILKGYLHHLLFFLIATVLTFRKFKRNLPDKYPADFLEAAAFQAWLYICLKRKLGQKKAFELVRVIITTAGTAVQQGNFRSVEASRTWENLIAYQQQTNREGPTRWNKVEILKQDDSIYEFKVKNCLFYDFFNHLNIPEMTEAVCSIDNIIFNCYLPEDITFHRRGVQQRISDGNPFCRFVVENHIKKDS